MAAINDHSLFPCLLVAASPDQGEKSKEASEYKMLPSTPELDQKEKHFQVGGPHLAGIWLFLSHCLNGVFLSSLSRIPFFGESPVWLRATVLAATIGSGFFDHLGGYIAHPSKLETLRNCTLPFGLIGLVFFISELYSILPAWESNTLVFLMIAILVGPQVAYKKITGKEVPTAYGDMVDSFSSRSGVVCHLVIDTAMGMFVVLCWGLVGQPPLMDWLRAPLETVCGLQ